MNLWRRLRAGPRKASPNARAYTHARVETNVSEAKDLRKALESALMFEGIAHSFWTGEQARDHDKSLLGKVERCVIGNGHMLTAIFELLKAQARIPSEITCPSCEATIRAPHADTLKR
jgi:hypothetical protein